MPIRSPSSTRVSPWLGQPLLRRSLRVARVIANLNGLSVVLHCPGPLACEIKDAAQEDVGPHFHSRFRGVAFHCALEIFLSFFAVAFAACNQAQSIEGRSIVGIALADDSGKGSSRTFIVSGVKRRLGLFEKLPDGIDRRFRGRRRHFSPNRLLFGN